MKNSGLVMLAILWLSANNALSQAIIKPDDDIYDYLRIQEIIGNDRNRSIYVHQNHFISTEGDTTDRQEPELWSNQLKFYKAGRKTKPTLTPIAPLINTGYNSKYPRSYNDGPLWNGRGLSLSLNAGFRFTWGRVTGIFYPNFSYSQNRAYTLQDNILPRSEFSYQLDDRIDWVQRFGDSSFAEFHPGQSSISIATGPISFKFSTENMRWGPGIANPIMMSTNAPGFPHIDIGTPKPIKTKAGDFEFHSIWGRLSESEYFDENEDNDHRYLAAVTFGYRPSFSGFLKGFSIGVGRVLYQVWPDSGLSFGDLFLGFNNFDGSATVTSTGAFSNDDTDQMVSINSRWFFEKAGFEVYYEYGRNDFWLDFKDLVSEPDHGAVLTFGFQKVFNDQDRIWRLGFEHTSLTTTRTIEIRNSHSIYLHSIARQGYTHRGQLIGAPIGPASRSQLITLSKFHKKGKLNFAIQRIRFDDDFVFRESRRTGRNIKHDVELNYFSEYVRFFQNYEISASLVYSRRANWHFDQTADVNNFQVLLGLKWHLSSPSRGLGANE